MSRARSMEWAIVASGVVGRVVMANTYGHALPAKTVAMQVVDLTDAIFAEAARRDTADDDRREAEARAAREADKAEWLAKNPGKTEADFNREHISW